MTPAEFKTAHECLGLSTEFIANRVGVTVGRIWAYEHPSRTADVPEKAAQVMLDLLNDFDAAADRLEAEYREEGEEILRHSDLAKFHAAVPELQGWPALSQGLLLAEVQRRTRLPIAFVS